MPQEYQSMTGKVPYSIPHTTSNEKYVNSGWLVPKGQEQNFPGSSNTFTSNIPKGRNISMYLHYTMDARLLQ
jgi:hypothetical protein